MEEKNAYDEMPSSENELMHMVSEGIGRDLRRYPNRFNAENE
jgi:hypothetical protein